ncbi:hypothetical protein GQ53DRAFT_717532 [Thozetella sp. PMI_491]|nr:hypothetical protein GQ53DRAFT_717532 [Thozetella sp. PMI_491]
MATSASLGSVDAGFLVLDLELSDRPRKIRKGTSSCWACKRRKVKCTFASSEEKICRNCHRRGSACLGQEQPEKLSSTRDHEREIGDRIVQVDALVANLAKQGENVAISGLDERRSTASRHQNSGLPAPSNYDDLHPAPVRGEHTPLEEGGRNASPQNRSHPMSNHRLARLHSPRASALGKQRDLSRTLLAAFPSAQDIDVIRESIVGHPMYFHLLNTKSHATLMREKPSPINVPSTAFAACSAETHPVLIAKQMFLFATVLQHPSFHDNIGRLGGTSRSLRAGLSEAPRAIMNRLVETAISLVTTNEELHGTIESLECLMMEGFYQINSGNLRRGWLAYRRAMLVAQLMGIHRPSSRPFKTINPDNKLDPQFLWYRIVYNDRHLCLLLGLPPGTLDQSIGSEAALTSDGPLGKLDRAHAVIAARILERNGRDLSEDDLATTQSIDADLLKVAQSMPSNFWLPPNFVGLEHGTEEIFWEALRTSSQVFHYNLLNQLHLPYLLRFSAEGKYDHSKLACMGASREMLSCFTAYRTSNPATTRCRTLDFFALMAAMTLLLAYLDSHLHKRGNYIMPHQRLLNRGMLERVVETMTLACGIDGDTMNEASVQVVRCLLRIEEEAAEGGKYNAQSVHDSYRTLQQEEREQEEGWEKDKVLQICIPYFGTIRIAREGSSGMDSAPGDPSPLHAQTRFEQYARTHSNTPPQNSARFGLTPLTYPRLEETAIAPELLHVQMLTGNSPQSTRPQEYTAHVSSANSNDAVLMQQYYNSSLIVGIDDWALQGVDTAFLDNLLRGS